MAELTIELAAYDIVATIIILINVSATVRTELRGFLFKTTRERRSLP
jgi:hypothetical protein